MRKIGPVSWRGVSLAAGFVALIALILLIRRVRSRTGSPQA
ncbi:MAG TPA: hypothetical protein VK533_03165 [Sphingomonas sp.]|nr:hypothetical protein [Sphingomonas sp.]HMI18524.1 hypothetical protein [Sphingomonas sp.]